MNDAADELSKFTTHIAKLFGGAFLTVDWNSPGQIRNYAGIVTVQGIEPKEVDKKFVIYHYKIT